ncbi:Outer membrane protein IcsA autotransporter precursor [Leminorella grimontii]|nr:Outer membrane protein IcsA autotransporter precursor [Leminorella grimontii]
MQGTSIGTFEQQNRIVAGAYDYSVVKGASDENWYLTSKVTPIDPEGPEGPEGPEQPGGESALRPEFGSYLANNYAANTMFLTRLHDRLGETQYTDVLTGEQKVTSMWMRNVGGHTRFRDSSEQLRTKSNRYVLQLGGDLAQWSSDGLDRWHLGAMVGYGNDRSKTVSSVNSRDSKGQTTGYSAACTAPGTPIRRISRAPIWTAG